jgi:response regulator of citrate/malate metabolism
MPKMAVLRSALITDRLSLSLVVMSRKISNLCIIDDDPMSSFYIKRLAELGEVASIITIYNNAQGAIDYLLNYKKSSENLPDIILLDIYMPGIDGWGFLAEFQKLKHTLPKKMEIYVISSSDHPSDIKRAKATPEVVDYFQKPVTMELLKGIVNDFFKEDNEAAS